MRIALAAAFLAILTACSPETEQETGGTGGPVETNAPAGPYRLDKSHASLIFRVDHLGFSNYTARFTDFDAELHFNPEDPAAMTVSASIDPNSIETDFPDPETLDFNAVLRGTDWLNTKRFPEITFQSTGIELTGPRTAKVTGDLALHGVTLPVTLDVTFNGGYRGHPMDPNARIGFSARGTFERCAFGISFGLPPEGSRMGVGNEVEVIIEAEFSGPPLVPSSAS